MSSKSKQLLASLQESRKPGSQQPVRQQYRVMDEVSRHRRNRQLLDQLERDNFHEDPHANLVMHKKAPKFDDGTIKGSVNMGTSGGSSNNRKSHVHRTRVLTFPQMVEEDSKKAEPNYSSASAPAPGAVHDASGRLLIMIPQRNFCSVCGFRAPYTCVTCGNRYCTVKCLHTHRDTRCLKWTV